MSADTTLPFPLLSQRVVLVTGPSGAGRATAIRALEDLDFEVIDNLPLSLVDRVIDGPALGRPLALGLDLRNRDFTPDAVVDLIDRIEAQEQLALQVLYLEASEDVLLRRYSETRRRHPAAPADEPLVGIRRERDLLGPVRARADIIVETSDLSPHDLKAEMERWFAPASGRGFGLTVQSFSYKRGMPKGLDLVFDCRFLRNPYWEPALRAQNGQDASVGAHIDGDPRFAPFFAKVADLVTFLLPAYQAEGKAHLSIGFGCTGGQHRSVYVAERLAQTLAADGWRVSKRHRELERRSGQTGVPHGQPGTGA